MSNIERKYSKCPNRDNGSQATEGHWLVYDEQQSDATKSVYICDCGYEEIEFQDSTP